MKKLLLGCALTTMMAVASVCSAAGDGNALNKNQKIAEALYNGLMKKNEVTYADATQGMVPALKAKITEKAYADLQKSMKDTYGKEKKISFRNFTRLDDGDILVYVGSFEKHEVVSMEYVFDKSGKLLSMNYRPVQKPAPAPAKPAPAPAPAQPAEEE